MTAEEVIAVYVGSMRAATVMADLIEQGYTVCGPACGCSCLAARATSTPAGLRERIAETFHDALCPTSHHDRPEVYAAATGGPQPCREKYERIALAALQGADR